MRRSLIIGSMLSIMVCSSSVYALDGITLEGGHTNESTDSLRLGLQFDFGRTLWQSDGGGAVLSGY